MIERLFLILIVSICILQVAAGQKDEKPITISGKVISPDNQPVAGAVFYVDNIKTSYFTNEKGAYKIKISPSAYKLKVSSSRFGTLDTVINGQTKIDFIFKPAEAFATGGVNDPAGGDRAKQTKPKPKKMNTYNNIYQMIQNEVSGVVVSGKSIVIQQQNSFFGSSDPLFVVDGVIVNTIDDVNPLEVKSISVLTGSSASIYGVRGANGVISITRLNGSEEEK